MDAEILQAWRDGIVEFNLGRYWHAHEQWEKRWNFLPSPDREQIQSLIQAAAVFHLIERGRLSPARSLIRSMLQKREIVRERGGASLPRVEIPGIEELLRELELRDDSGIADLSAAKSLRAVLIES